MRRGGGATRGTANEIRAKGGSKEGRSHMIGGGLETSWSHLLLPNKHTGVWVWVWVWRASRSFHMREFVSNDDRCFYIFIYIILVFVEIYIKKN